MSLLSNEELLAKANCSQDAKLKRWLSSNSVPYFLDTKGKAITTTEAITQVLASPQAAVAHEIELC